METVVRIHLVVARSISCEDLRSGDHSSDAGPTMFGNGVFGRLIIRFPATVLAAVRGAQNRRLDANLRRPYAKIRSVCTYSALPKEKLYFSRMARVYCYFLWAKSSVSWREYDDDVPFKKN